MVYQYKWSLLGFINLKIEMMLFEMDFLGINDYFINQKLIIW